MLFFFFFSNARVSSKFTLLDFFFFFAEGSGPFIFFFNFIFNFFLFFTVALSAAFPQTFAAFAASRHGFMKSKPTATDLGLLNFYFLVPGGTEILSVEGAGETQ